MHYPDESGATKANILEIKISEFEYQQVMNFDGTLEGKNTRYWSAENRRATELPSGRSL